MGIDSYANAVREALNDKGTYDESLEITIHMLACSLRVYSQVQHKLDNDLIKTEYTREKDARYKLNPLFPALIHSGEQVRKYLRELKLTKALSGRDDEDGGESDESSGLSQLMDAVKDAGVALGPRMPKTKRA
jgi:hypothetical protein